MRLIYICFAAISVTAAGHSQTPTIADGGVANAASFDRGTGVAPGSMVAIYGSSLATALARSDSVPMSTSVSDVAVTFNGIAAPVQLVSPDRKSTRLNSS